MKSWRLWFSVHVWGMGKTWSVYIILGENMTDLKAEDHRKIGYKIKDNSDCLRVMSSVSI
jgi:hypothetical protein